MTPQRIHLSRAYAPKPGSGVRPLYHYYRQLRPMPAHKALNMARYHERLFAESDLFQPPPRAVLHAADTDA
jgi:hypothetical protein